MADTDRGETRDLEVRPPTEPGGEWQVSDWTEIVFPGDRGVIGHNTSASRLPDTVVVRLAGQAVALADAFTHTLDNQYCYDAEYYLVLRVREVLVADAWRTLPWGQLGPGDVFHAWDKFHDIAYARTPNDATTMSYGGDWHDLQHVVDQEHGWSAGPRPSGPASAASLLRAVRAGDVAQVLALLQAGADPNAGQHAPDEALRSVSVDRDTTALWEATMADSPAMVEALISAGASLSAPPGRLSPLWGALLNNRIAVIPVLLRHGADPDEPRGTQTARMYASTCDPDVAAMFA